MIEYRPKYEHLSNNNGQYSREDTVPYANNVRSFAIRDG
jgi:hypothetical protein